MLILKNKMLYVRICLIWSICLRKRHQMATMKTKPSVTQMDHQRSSNSAKKTRITMVQIRNQKCIKIKGMARDFWLELYLSICSKAKILCIKGRNQVKVKSRNSYLKSWVIQAAKDTITSKRKFPVHSTLLIVHP